MKKVGFALILLVLIIPVMVFARLGVGVGVGKITVDEDLKAGMIYELPSVPVLNTGDEPSEYEMSVEYHEGVPQIRPAREWFSFNPATFFLEPGKVQTVRINLNLPLKVAPGDYFCYLEAHPIKKTEAGTTTIGIAAAAKLYFTVAPANIFQGIYYRILSLWIKYSPWTWVVFGSVLAGAGVAIFRKFFSLQFGIKRRRKNE